MYLICGEALFDFFGEDATDERLAFDARIGGSPLNVAIGLARLGESVGFLGGISKDTLGEKLVEKLLKERVSDRYVVRSDYLTTLSLVQRDGSGSPAYTFYGANAADRMLLPTDIPTFEEPPRFLHVGSYTVLVEPVAETLKALINQQGPETLISFDPNIRPTVEPDMDLWRRNTEALVPKCDLIKVSDEDLSLIAPGEPCPDIARRWVDAGAGLVVVTKGAHGADAYSKTVETGTPGIAVKVEDTVGAGDTFQAGLLAGLKQLGVSNKEELFTLDEKRLERLLAFATAAAAVTCSRRGADLPRRSELEKEWAALI